MTIMKTGSQAFCDEYIGTADELIGADLVLRSQLPGTPGMPKFAATFYAGALARRGRRVPQDEHYVRVRRLGHGLFCVIRGLRPEQREERQAKIDAIFALERAELEAAEAMRLVPSSASNYRERCISELRGNLEFFRATRLGSDEFGAKRRGGFKFDDDSLESFDDVVADLLAVLRNGSVGFDRKQHCAVVAGIQTKVAKADVPLQELIAGAIASVAIRSAEEGQCN
jgi:hypothetical protein